MTTTSSHTPSVRISPGGGDDTVTLMMEKKKRAYKRKDCGGDTSSSVTIVKKRKQYSGDTKGKDCVGDTIITPTIMEKPKRRAYKRKDSGTNTPTLVETTKTKRTYRRKKYLPHDIIVEQILTRLPVQTLLTSVRVSKLWYNSIHNDHKRLTYSHFLQSQKRPELVFSLFNVCTGDVTKKGQPRYASHFFKFQTGYLSKHVQDALQFQLLPGGLGDPETLILVGYCNGLPCAALVRNHTTAYIIMDPNRKDFIYIFYPLNVGKRISKARIVCHGFGFNPSANEYKVVSLFQTSQKELNFLVFTLGTKSWRNVDAPILGPGGRPILKMTAPTGTDKSAIFCTSSGCLAWKIIATLGEAGIQHDHNSNDVDVVSDEMEMLLLFNIQDENFHFIQLPSAKSTTDDEHQDNLLVDYPHLLGFKGCPCIARIEKTTGNGGDCPHRCRDDHKGSGTCCCCSKVHLYVLKDNGDKVWVKDKCFDVRINSSPTWLANTSFLAPEPCCFCFGSTSTPPTRILSFSDQVLLYWFGGKYLQVYDLGSQKLQLVLPFEPRDNVIFRSKMEHTRNSGDDCSNMDFQLHCHEENFLSLQTFIPQGAEGVSADKFRPSELKKDDRPCSAYAFINRASEVVYPFF